MPWPRQWAQLANDGDQTCCQPDDKTLVNLIKNLLNIVFTYQHDDNISICMIPEFSEPSLDILVCEMLGNVVDQKSSHSSSVVRTGDSSVPLLASRVPDLGLDSLSINLDKSNYLLDIHIEIKRLT